MSSHFNLSFWPWMTPIICSYSRTCGFCGMREREIILELLLNYSILTSTIENHTMKIFQSHMQLGTRTHCDIPSYIEMNHASHFLLCVFPLESTSLLIGNQYHNNWPYPKSLTFKSSRDTDQIYQHFPTMQLRAHSRCSWFKKSCTLKERYEREKVQSFPTGNICF